MQMLGEEITDSLGLEHKGSVHGLGLLPIRTVMQPNKLTRNATGELACTRVFRQAVGKCSLAGYEIHVGQTAYQAGATHFAVLAHDSLLSNSKRDGCISDDTRIFGTYLHGIFDGDSFRHLIIRAARAFHQLAPPTELRRWKQLREESLNRLAYEVENALDMREIFSWVGLGYSRTAARTVAGAEMQKQGGGS